MASDHANTVLQHVRRVILGDGASLSDGQLLNCFIEQRDEDAFAALVKRHGPMVWGVCRRVLQGHQDAEDAFQATFLVLVRKAVSITPREMVGNWLYGVAVQTAVRARSMNVKRRTRERQVQAMPEPPAFEQDLWSDLQPLLDQELSRLPDKYRMPVILCDLEGKTYLEAAQQIGCPAGTLAARLSRARTMLAKRLTRHGLAISSGTLAVLMSERATSASVPILVVTSTIKAASLLTVGRLATANPISAKVALLTEGVLKSMLLTKLRIAMAVLIVMVMGTLGAGIVMSLHSAEPGDTANASARNQNGPNDPTEDVANRDSQPHYCWLVMGPNARVRALVRMDGEEVAIDRDGDGKFDGKGERFASEKDCQDVMIADPDGKTSYVITYLHLLHVTPPEKFLEVRVHILGPLEYHQGAIIPLTKDRTTALQAHYHGPLTIAPKCWTIENRARRLLKNEMVDLGSFLPQSLLMLAGKRSFIESMLPRSFKRGQPTDLAALIVTEGKDTLVCVCSPDVIERKTSPFPEGVHPVVDVEFPAKKEGGLPNRKRYPLDQNVGEGLFRGPVRVSEEAGVGMAKVTFSFDSWKGMKVASTTVEIPLDEPQEDKKDQQQAAEPPMAQRATGEENKEKQPAVEKDDKQDPNAWFEQALRKAAEDNLKDAKKALQGAEMSYFQIVQIRSIRTQLYGRASEQDVFFNESARKTALESMERARLDLQRAERNLELAKNAQPKKKVGP